MINFDSVSLSNEGVSIPLGFKKTKRSDPYIIKQIIGLGPPDIDVSLGDKFPEGSVYQGQHPNGRQLVYTIKLNPNNSENKDLSALRQALYLLYADTDSSVKSAFSSEGAQVLMTEGYISKFEIAPFEKEGLVQITIDCPSPYLFGNEVVLNPSPGEKNVTIDYQGTAQVGFEMSALWTSSFTDNPIGIIFPKGQFFQVTQYSLFQTNDKFFLSTVPGERELKRISGYTVQNLYSQMNPGSTWYRLKPGFNTIGLSPNTQASAQWDYIKYTPIYWGV